MSNRPLDRGASQSQIPVQSPDGSKPIPIMVEAGARYEGLLAFRGNAQIDGELNGDVVAQGKLWIGEAARVKGRVEADELVVAGGLEGEGVARERIEILATARVEAALQAPRIALAEGSFVQGCCRSGDADEAAKSKDSQAT